MTTNENRNIHRENHNCSIGCALLAQGWTPNNMKPTGRYFSHQWWVIPVLLLFILLFNYFIGWNLE